MITINDIGIVVVHLFEVLEMWPCKMKGNSIIVSDVGCCSVQMNVPMRLIKALAALSFLCIKDLQKFLEKPLALFKRRTFQNNLSGWDHEVCNP